MRVSTQLTATRVLTSMELTREIPMVLIDFLLTLPFLLINVLLYARELVLEGVEDLGVAVVEKLAVLVLFLDGLSLEGVLAQACALLSHYVFTVFV